MTKHELLIALTRRYQEGRQRSQAGNDWAAGFRAAHDEVKRLLAAPTDAEPEPVAVTHAADGIRRKTTYDPNLTAAEACGPFNPARALDARRNP